MREELTHRLERFPWHGHAYWQRSQPPWCLVATLQGVNISSSGLLAEGDVETLASIFAVDTAVLQLNGDDCYAVVEAVCVRRQQRQVAFAFTASNAELEKLLAQVSAEAR